MKLRSLMGRPESQTSAEFKRIADEERARGELERQQLDVHLQKAAALMMAHSLTFSRGSVELDPAKRSWFNNIVKPSLLRLRFNQEPLTVTHCAVHADRGVFHIPQTRNWGLSCDDFCERKRVPSCPSCEYYQESEAEERERKKVQDLTGKVVQYHERAAQFLTDRARQIEQSIDPIKALDLRESYDSRGILIAPVQYLPTCKVPIGEALGGQTAYRAFQPEIYNRFLGCQFFLQKPLKESSHEESHNQGVTPIQPRREPTVIDALGLDRTAQLDAIPITCPLGHRNSQGAQICRVCGRDLSW